MLLTRPVLSADDAAGIALLNCLVREVCTPEDQVRHEGDHLVIRLPRVGVVLRAVLRRIPVGPSFRLTPPIEEQQGTGWLTLDTARLADLAAGELELATGRANPEFTGQVTAGRAAMAALIEAREHLQDHGGECAGVRDRAGVRDFIDSEQALVAGHRFHPAPKARQGAAEEWLPYAPEAGVRFPLRWLGIRSELVAEEGDLGALDAIAPRVPSGHRALPVHPWQLSLLGDRPMLRAALAARTVIDLGPAGPEAAPTSSVRTLYVPDADVFCKFSLHVRITNCVRKNSWYELTAAVALSRLLGPVFAELGAGFGGCALLAEPGYRSVALADLRLHEGLGVIIRSGVGGCQGTPLLAAALADPYGCSPAALSRLLAGVSAEGALTWWDAYVRLVVPPVLHAFLAYGVALEPHLQNVLVAVDAEGLPIQVIFRDLEGTKLVPGPGGVRWDLSGLPARVAEALTYDTGRGWNRVLYCLFVNHLAEIAAALGDLHPDLEGELWRRARRRIEHYARDHADDLPAEARGRLRALLAGTPLPGKANLRARWSRAADRHAAYVPVPNPFGTP